MRNKDKLKKEVWSKKSYYQKTKGGVDIGKPGMNTLLKLSKSAKSVLDLGCGNGERLAFLTKNSKNGTGVDVSKTAINLAKNKFPPLKFLVGDLEKLSFKSDNFDLVYLAYVLEHLSNPEKVINEAIRVTKIGGHLAFLAPNFGAPNRASPPYSGSRILKLLKGFIDDFIYLISSPNGLRWNKVTPIANEKKYDMDWDTTVEPYLLTLKLYLSKKGVTLVKVDSCWNEELMGAKLHQKIYKLFSMFGLYPFKYWGPHIFLVVKKNG